MTTLLRPEVGRLRIHGGDRARARRQTADVERSERRPAGLPARAVLVVRTAVGRPGPPGHDTVAAGIEEAWRRARRPWVQAVDDAPAVWFADEAELLASLVFDLALEAADRWWWERVRPQVGEDVARVVAGAPRLVPVALDRIEAAGAVDVVLAALAPPDAAAIAASVALSFAADAADVDTVRAAVSGGATATAVGGAPLAHAWLMRIARVGAVRPAAVPADVHAVAAAVRDGAPPGQAVAVHPVADHAVPDHAWHRPGTGAATTTPRAGPDEQRPRRAAGERTVARPDGHSRGDSGPAPGGGAVGHAAVSASSPAATPVASGASGTEVTGDTHDPAAGPDDPAARAPAGDPVVGVTTELAGFVFLVDVLHRLGLPDALAGWELDAVGAGTVLEAVVRALLREPRPGEATDPLWRVLAALDGRDPDEPVVARNGPQALPIHWRPADPPVAAAAATSQPATLLDDLHPSLAALGALLGDHVEAVLARRLAGITDDPPAALVRQRGIVTVSTTHLEVTLPLDSLWLPGRLAGLDLDPGWVPWMGRVVLVHFR